MAHRSDHIFTDAEPGNGIGAGEYVPVIDFRLPCQGRRRRLSSTIHTAAERFRGPKTAGDNHPRKGALSAFNLRLVAPSSWTVANAWCIVKAGLWLNLATRGVPTSMSASKTIYADYQATTPVDPRVLEKMAPHWTERFGNPHSSDHIVGWKAAEVVRESASSVAELIGADAR